MIRVDYFLGVDPDATTEMLLQPHFYKWYEAVKPYLDTNIISVPNDRSIFSKLERVILRTTALPIVMRRRQDSILHIASVNLVNQTVALMSQSPLVVTCFDAIIYEENAHELALRRPERIVLAHKQILKRADRIITISNHARNRISDLCSVDLNKVDAIHLAVDHNLFHPRELEEKDELRKLLGFAPEKQNILYVGSESPRKNLTRVIEAIAILRQRFDIHFVKIGAFKEPYHSQLLSLVNRLGLGDVVHFHGTVPAAYLPLAYNLADVFVFPSLYEGFGVPPLEAMASGCPVVTSATTSLAEIVGDAAEIVDPYDSNSIAEGISKILSDHLHHQSLVKKGREQSLRFNWEITAKKTLDVYRKLL